MAQNQELANSFAGSAVGSKSGDNPTGYQLDKRALWGLYAVYAAIGTVNGFFATYLQGPTICQFVFGPMGPHGHVRATQCNVAASVFQMPWNFKLFLGFFLDNVSFFGSRRKGWLLFGWTGGLIMLAVNALTVDGYINQHSPEGWSSFILSLMAMCAFYTFSDVAGDGLIIELSKYEPDDRRGYILTSCQMIRFTMMMVITIYGMLTMSGSDYQNPAGDADALVFPFQLPFNMVLWGVLVMALPFYVAMWMFLQDPPPAEEHPRGLVGMSQSIGRIWTALKSYAVFMLLIQVVGINGISGMLNPAAQALAAVSGVTSFQTSLGSSLGNIAFVAGVWLFRKYLLTYNWRITLIWTHSLLGLLGLSGIMIIYDTFHIGQNGYFYMFYNQGPSFIQGLTQVLGSLAVIEISPPGLEATIFELIISASNGANTLEAVLQSQFSKPFQLKHVGATVWKERHCSRTNGTWGDLRDPICNTWEHHMASATWLTMAINIGAAIMFMWFIPKNAAHCRQWAAKASWHETWAGLLNVVVFLGPFSYAIYKAFQLN